MSETLEYLQGRFLQSGPEDALNKLPVRPELVQRGPEDALNKLAVRPELVEACPERSRRGRRPIDWLSWMNIRSWFPSAGSGQA